MSSETDQYGKINSKFVLKYKNLIQVFEKCPVTIQYTLISNSPNDFVRLLSEISLNVLFNTLSLSKACIKQLKVYKSLILYLSDRDISLATKAKRLKRNKEKNRKFVLKLFRCIQKHLE